MQDEAKTKAQLIEELKSLRQRVATLEAEMSHDPLFLEALLEAIPIPVFYKDKAGIYRDCNRAFAEQILGLPRSEIVGRSLYDLSEAIPPALADIYHKQDLALLEKQGMQVYETEAECADGIRRDFILHKATLTDASGQAVGLIGAMLDITERKKTEESLRKSEQKYRRLFESLQEGIWMIDEAGYTTLVNPRMAEMLGYPVPEMEGRHLFSFMDEKAVELAQLNLERRRQGLREQHDFEFLKKDGSRLYAALAVTPLTDEQGNYGGALAGVIDITERKEAEESLRRSQEQYRLLFERMVSGFALLEMIYDETGTPVDCRYVEVNPAHERLTGLETAEILGRTAREAMPDLEEEWIEAYGQVDQTGEPAEIQNYVKQLQKWYRVFAYRPRPGLVAITFEDITERKQAEQAQRRYTEGLEALRRMGLQIAAELELETLLQSIVSQAIRLLAAAGGGLFLYRPEPDLLEWIVATEPNNMPPVGTVLRPGEGLSGKIWEQSQPMIVNDYQNWPGRTPSFEKYIPDAVAGVPIYAGEEFLGVLLVNKDAPNTFFPDEVELLELFGAQAAIAIKNARLYKQVRQDAETKTTLLEEVNHRVKNNLMGIIGLLYATRRYANPPEDRQSFSALVEDLVQRIEGLATVHRLLAANEWSPLRLDELAREIIASVLQSLLPDQRVITDIKASAPVRVTPKQASNLAILLNELTTNTVKYALPTAKTARITLRIAPEERTIMIEFRDEGPGYPPEVLRLERHKVGLYLIQAMATDSLRGELKLYNEPGAVAKIRFPLERK